MAASLTILIFLLIYKPKNRLEARLRELKGKPAQESDAVRQLATTALPKMGAALLPGKEEERTRLQARLIQAGLYGRQTIYVFLGVKLLLMVVPPLLGAVVGILEVGGIGL